MFVATPQTYGAVLAFGTGPRQLNAKLRERANALGLIYDFNGHREQCFAQFSPFVSLRKPIGELVTTPTEASFFQRLDVPHVPPAYREWLAASDFVDGTLRPTLTTPEPWRSPCCHMGQRIGQLRVGDGDQFAYSCTELGRCLPDYRPTENALAAWLVRDEASHYHLCHGCRLRQPTAPGEPSLAHHV
ncbi:MAG: hypothetical protein KDA44_21945 [Planctomycetales bacterium]|nr:hypothetical protein [Planctomycetales bacterium]